MKEKKLLEYANNIGLALTFGDVRLRSGYSEVMPSSVNLETRLSRNINLKVPLVSAAMDSVTEYKLAISLAKLGGIGVIHKSLSIEEQAFHVMRVKHHLNGLIERPITVRQDDSIESVLNMKNDKKYLFNSFPVVDDTKRLVGLVTGNDFEFCDDHSLQIKDIMTDSLLTATSETDVLHAYTAMKNNKKKVLPLVDYDGILSGMYVFSDVKRIVTKSNESYNLDKKGRLMVAAAVGCGDEAIERTRKLVHRGVDVIVIDSAHADSSPVYETLKKIKKEFSIDVVVGNVSIGESAKRLVEMGADGIKVGQGPGSICTTRIVAGIGRPQVSAIYDCAKAINNSFVPIIADGGLKYSGDIPIAIAAGADSVMLGSMLAGTYEAPGEEIFYQGRSWKCYRGMGSVGAMENSKSARERYLQSDFSKDKLVPEGVEGLVPFKGRLEDIVYQYLGGLRAGMGYVGAANIEELKDKGEFDQITGAGLTESHPHDINITKDSPNYMQ